MIEKNRTRRAVIKKLKELGMIFKAPTRKSVAAGVSKHAWFHEQDMRLRELYDQHRLDDGKIGGCFLFNLHTLFITIIYLILSPQTVSRILWPNSVRHALETLSLSV